MYSLLINVRMTFIQDRHFLVSHFLGCDTHLPMWMRTLVHCPHGTCEATEIDINMKLMMLAVFWVLSLTSECAVFFNPPFFKLWRIYLFSCMYSKIPDSLYFSSNVVCYSLYISSLQSLAISSFLSYFCSIWFSLFTEYDLIPFRCIQHLIQNLADYLFLEWTDAFKSS